MQVAQDDASVSVEVVLAALKQQLEAHKATLDYRCCGIRICSAKNISDKVQDAVQTFELTPSHYYIYHVGTESISSSD